MKWRPIDTAPKDGTPVIVAEDGIVFEAYFHRFGDYELSDEADWDIAGMGVEDRRAKGGFWYTKENNAMDGEHGGTGDTPSHPTHWMPLPAPPATLEDHAHKTADELKAGAFHAIMGEMGWARRSLGLRMRLTKNGPLIVLDRSLLLDQWGSSGLRGPAYIRTLGEAIKTANEWAEESGGWA